MSDFRPHAEYLKDLDILMVYLREGRYARAGAGGIWTNIDLDAEGNVLSVEFVNAASMGLDFTGVPEREWIEQLIREAGLTLPVPA